MQFQGPLTHKLLDLSTNATPKLLTKMYKFMTPSYTDLNDRGAPLLVLTA